MTDGSYFDPPSSVLTRRASVRHTPEVKELRVSVLLVAGDGPAERSILRTLKKKGLEAEWAKTAGESRLRAEHDELRPPEVAFVDVDVSDGEELVSFLRARFPLATLVALGVNLNGERAARLLGIGVSALNKPVSPNTLAELAILLGSKRIHQARTNAHVGANEPQKVRGWVGALKAALESYALNRALSQQQRVILRFYLCGDNDKQIAQMCSCSEATVYEHWRRMGKKAGGSTKADVIADFHRYLVGAEA